MATKPRISESASSISLLARWASRNARSLSCSMRSSTTRAAAVDVSGWAARAAYRPAFGFVSAQEVVAMAGVSRGSRGRIGWGGYRWANLAHRCSASFILRKLRRMNFGLRRGADFDDAGAVLADEDFAGFRLRAPGALRA